MYSYSPQKEETRKKTEEIFEGIMAKDFPKLSNE